MQPRLLACPFDNGIQTMLRWRRGVTGAADGPAAILAQLPADWPREVLPLAEFNLPPDPANLFDAEFIRRQQAATETAHEWVSAGAARHIEAGFWPLALGGDHSLTFPLLRGVRRALPNRRLGLIYIDAHLDMRPLESCAGVDGLVSSGNSFRRLIEAGLVAGPNIAAIGIHRSESAVFAEMLAFARAHGVAVVFDDADDEPEDVAARALAALAGTDGFYLSVDIDAVEAWAAPGVSAPAAVGLPPAFVLALVRALAGSGRLVAADVVEVSARRLAWGELFGQPAPETEADRQAKLLRTAKLAAQVVQTIVEMTG